MNIDEAKELLGRYRAGLCSEQEKRIVEQWLDSLATEEAEDWMDDRNELREALHQRIRAAIVADSSLPALPRRRFTWWHMVAAVLIVILTSAGLYYSFTNNKNERSLAEEKSASPVSNEILPGSQGAVLTLGDGRQIVLDSAGNGDLAMQSDVAVKHIDGQLVYDGKNAGKAALMFNTVTTPLGRQFRLQLSDGTQVWLNAGSSIRYPAKFNDTLRTVEIAGEAYFEVETLQEAGKPKTPFIVRIMKNDAEAGQVKVTGTVFNINAYADETATKTTLLEGGIIFNAKGQSRIVKPGQQVQLKPEGSIQVVSKVNVSAETAWKNGFFFCDETTGVETVMRQLSRWYNIDVSYQDGKIPDEKYWGEIPRTASLQTVLKVLEMSGVKFRIEGRQVIVIDQ